MLHSRLQENAKQFWDETMTQLINSSLTQHRLQHSACWQNTEQWIKEANPLCPVATNSGNVCPLPYVGSSAMAPPYQGAQCFSSMEVLGKQFALFRMFWLPASAEPWESRMEWNTQRQCQLSGSSGKDTGRHGRATARASPPGNTTGWGQAFWVVPKPEVFYPLH